MALPLCAALGVFLVARNGLIDDALITASAARTLAEYGEWAVVPGVPSNSQTSPLNVLVLAGVTLLVRSAIVAIGVVWLASVALVSVCAEGVSRRLGLGPWAGPLVGLLVGTSPLVTSTIGLETSLVAALLLALAWALAHERTAAVGVVAGMLILARPDLTVVAALGVALCGKAGLRATAVALPLGGSFYVWSWWHLGSAVPDTYFLRTGGTGWSDDLGGTGVWHTFTFTNPLALYVHYHQAETLAVVASVGGGVLGALVLARRSPKIAAALAGGGLVHLLAMIAVDPGPVAWYYAPFVVGVGAAGVLGAAAAGRAALGVAALIVLAGATVTVARAEPWVVPPIIANYGAAPQYAAVAAALPDGPVVSPGEVGALAFYCADRCQVLDAYTDGGRAASVIRSRLAAANGVSGVLLRLNFIRWAPRPAVATPWQLHFTKGSTSPPSDTDVVASWPTYTVWHPGNTTLLLHSTSGSFDR